MIQLISAQCSAVLIDGLTINARNDQTIEDEGGYEITEENADMLTKSGGEKNMTSPAGMEKLQRWKQITDTTTTRNVVFESNKLKTNKEAGEEDYNDSLSKDRQGWNQTKQNNHSNKFGK